MQVDIDAVLAEFARHPTPKAPRGGGRRLDGAAPSSDATDTDAAMKWMEARIDALAKEVASAPSAAPPTAQKRPPPDRSASASIAERGVGGYRCIALSAVYRIGIQ